MLHTMCNGLEVYEPATCLPLHQHIILRQSVDDVTGMGKARKPKLGRHTCVSSITSIYASPGFAAAARDASKYVCFLPSIDT
jgi:hypothetical protein